MEYIGSDIPMKNINVNCQENHKKLKEINQKDLGEIKRM